MYGLAQNPVLDFLGMAAAIAAGLVFVSDPRGPLANRSLFTRFAALLGVTFVAVTVFDQILVFFSPMFNGQSNGAAVLEFFGGLALLAGLIAAFMVVRGDLKINLERSAPPGRVASGPMYSSGPTSSDACAQCGGPLKLDAIFCNNCGARTQAIA
jgi:hypothetical protein